MQKVSFYIMNSKGLFVLKRFIEAYGSNAISYIVSEQDKSLQYDCINDIKLIAKNNNIPFYQRAHLDTEIEDNFLGLKFAIGWRWLIKNTKNLVVFHDSLLPKYRGFAPLVNSLINNELQGGVTALFADNKYDQGDIIAQESTNFSYPIKIEDAIKQIEPIYFHLVDKIYKYTLTGKALTGQKQDESEATYSLWLDSKDYFIDWTWSAKKIKRFVDAVGYPYDGAKAWLNDCITTFKEVEEVNDVIIEHRDRHIGKVIFVEENVPIIICSKGLLALKEITDENNITLQINFRSRFQ
ncbi:formyltransferase family protein [Vibrio sp. NTOU-M3]|uniref:formyltransferase family protein n=1 Tax=Vibrio sp. NTOU-M3 TaxID=3234954 RepID=UPI00349F5A7E